MKNAYLAKCNFFLQLIALVALSATPSIADSGRCITIGAVNTPSGGATQSNSGGGTGSSTSSVFCLIDDAPPPTPIPTPTPTPTIRPERFPKLINPDDELPTSLYRYQARRIALNGGFAAFAKATDISNNGVVVGIDPIHQDFSISPPYNEFHSMGPYSHRAVFVVDSSQPGEFFASGSNFSDTPPYNSAYIFSSETQNREVLFGPNNSRVWDTVGITSFNTQLEIVGSFVEFDGALGCFRNSEVIDQARPGSCHAINQSIDGSLLADHSQPGAETQYILYSRNSNSSFTPVTLPALFRPIRVVGDQIVVGFERQRINMINYNIPAFYRDGVVYRLQMRPGDRDGEVSGLNSYLDVVGNVCSQTGCKAVFWDLGENPNAVPETLESVTAGLEPGSTITNVVKLTNSRKILVEGYRNGEPRTYVLEPIRHYNNGLAD